MIPRYSQDKITSIWSDKNRYEIWLNIEVLVCEKLCIDKKISKKDFLNIKKKARIDVKDITGEDIFTRLKIWNF